MDRKIREKIKNVFENIFFIFLQWAGPSPKEIGPRWAQNKTGPEPGQKENLLSTRLGSAQPCGLDY